MSEVNHLLTIAIPTYNRIQQLNNTLHRLLPQLTDDCFLLIIDNCSDIPVVEFTKEIFEKYPSVHYEIRRNRVNIGGDSNIIRCFEYCETQWLWTLGDDDEIFETAISTIFDDIKQYPDILYISYNSPSVERPLRNKPVFSNNRLEFLRNMDSLGAMMYISCNIYNNPKFKDVHNYANSNTYSSASQWLILLYYLSEHDGKTLLSDKRICSNPFVPDIGSTANLRIARGLATLLDIPMSVAEKKIIVKQLKNDNFFTLEGILKSLLLMYQKNKDLEIHFLFSRYYHILYRHYGLKIRAKFKLLQLFLFISPQYFYILIKYFLKKYKNHTL